VESIPMTRYIREEAAGLPWGSTLVVVSAQPDEKLMATLLDLKRVGRSVTLIVIGSEVQELNAAHFPVYYVSDAVAWELINEIKYKEELETK